MKRRLVLALLGVLLMETAWTLPGDGATILATNGGAIVRSYNLLNETDVPAQLLDGLGQSVAIVSPGKRGANNGNWPNGLQAKLIQASTYGLAHLTLSDGRLNPETGFQPPQGQVLVPGSAILPPSGTVTALFADSGTMLEPEGSTWELAWLSAWVEPLGTNQAAVPIVWQLVYGTSGSNTVIVEGGGMVSFTGTGAGGGGTPIQFIAPLRGAPRIVVPSSGTVQFYIQRSAGAWTVTNQVLIQYQAMFVPATP